MFVAIILSSTLAHAVLWWVVSLRMQRNDVADVGWWIGFVVVSIMTLLIGEASATLVLATLCIALWWMRLAWHIGRKVFSPESREDRRYVAMRQKWGDATRIKSLSHVFLLQGLCMLPVLSPLFVIATSRPQDIWAFQITGLAIFLIWLTVETVADSQMLAFRKATEDKARFLSTWLWRYSRHPNYFWESMVWCGMAAMAGWRDLWYLGLLSPIFITFLLLRVSGLPLSEAKRRNDPEYREYVRRTNGLFPWFPREAETNQGNNFPIGR